MKIPGYSDKTKHLPMLIITKRRAMTRLVITQCFKSYDVNTCRQYAFTPLTKTVRRHGREKMLRLLCERADVLVNKQDGHGCTALHCLSANGNVKSIHLCRERGRAATVQQGITMAFDSHSSALSTKHYILSLYVYNHTVSINFSLVSQSTVAPTAAVRGLGSGLYAWALGLLWWRHGGFHLYAHSGLDKDGDLLNNHGRGQVQLLS